MISVLYELMYIIDGSLPDEEAQRLESEMRSIIEKNGGTITRTSNWGKRMLAYPVKKHSEGYYVNMDFSGPANLPDLFTEYVATHPGILRHMTLKVPKARLEQEKMDEAKKEKELQAAREAREREANALREAKTAEENAAMAQENRPVAENTSLPNDEEEDFDDDIVDDEDD